MLRTLYRDIVTENTGYLFAGFADDGVSLGSQLASSSIHLVLLDILLPAFNGPEDFRRLRAEQPRVDFIILSSEKAPDIVRGTICSGAFDYLIKPFEWDRFRRALKAYEEYHRSLVGRKRPWKQEDIDRVTGFKKRMADFSRGIPKGFQETLINRITNLLDESELPLSAQDTGRMLGISRSSARRYLEYLAEECGISVKFQFSQVGRPKKLYFIPEKPVDHRREEEA
ncbi:MAG: response regulator [Synergistaceae bacterium]|nr:response regulator [Synergistaceae bacterium]